VRVLHILVRRRVQAIQGATAPRLSPELPDQTRRAAPAQDQPHRCVNRAGTALLLYAALRPHLSTHRRRQSERLSHRQPTAM